MATVASPYGLRPIGKVGQRYVGSRRAFVVTTNNTAAIFNGDPVTINAGVITVCSATPITTRGTTTPIGVFVGCEYIDPVSGLRESQYLPANAVTAGYTKIRVFVEDDPNCLFQIQSDGSITAAQIGLNATLVMTAGSTTTGNSKVALSATTPALTATFAVRIVDLVNSTSSTGGTSTPGDAFTDCIVRWNFGVHAYENGTGA